MRSLLKRAEALNERLASQKATSLAREIKKTLSEAVKTNDEGLLHRVDALMQELRRELQGGDSASYTLASERQRF